MISEKSNRLYKQILTVAFFLNGIPYKRVTSPLEIVMQLQISPSLKLYKWTLAGNLIAQFTLANGLILWISFGSLGPVLTLCILTALALIVLCVGIQLLLFFGHGSYYLIVNALQNLQTDFGRLI